MSRQGGDSSPLEGDAPLAVAITPLKLHVNLALKTAGEWSATGSRRGRRVESPHSQSRTSRRPWNLAARPRDGAPHVCLFELRQRARPAVGACQRLGRYQAIGSRRSLLLQTPDGKRPNFRDTIEVAIDMNHAKTVVQGGLRDEQVGDRGPMPHALVMREVVLKAKRSVQ
jgi:hypothetical protein